MLLSFVVGVSNCYVVCKVCVSEVRIADANGRYTHAAVHDGQPAYRLATASAGFWICFDGVAWCLVRQEVRPGKTSLYSKLFRNERAGFAEGKVSTGRWLDPEGRVLCNMAYEYDEKARVRI